MIRVRRGIDKVLQESDKKNVARVTEAFLQMKKLDIAKLKKAYNEDSQEMVV
ncbi:MAG: hypothetical protein M3275_12675 [Thermoproteota archaeon]|nr:hypothetical protein [Thermoproteota archaeon]